VADDGGKSRRAPDAGASPSRGGGDLLPALDSPDRDRWRTLAETALDHVGDSGFTIAKVDEAIHEVAGDGPLVERLLEDLAQELGVERAL
jgi:hypothetical protein